MFTPVPVDGLNETSKRSNGVDAVRDNRINPPLQHVLRHLGIVHRPRAHSKASAFDGVYSRLCQRFMG